MSSYKLIQMYIKETVACVCNLVLSLPEIPQFQFLKSLSKPCLLSATATPTLLCRQTMTYKGHISNKTTVVSTSNTYIENGR